MSFSDLLWDNFEVVNRHALDHRKGTEDLLQVFKDIASLYDAFGRGMEKISTSSYIVTTTEGSLSHAVASLKTDCVNKADQAKILVESINNDLIEPLRDLLKNQNNNIKKPTTEGKKVEKEMQGYAEKLEKSKARYYKACEECEQLTIVLENKLNKEKRLKLMAKLVAVKREVEASLKLYQESLAASNAYRERYKSLMMKILEVYQKQEEQRLESIKDMLRKLVVYQTSFLRNLQYDVDNLAHVTHI
jgi:hypothetical protein